MKHLLLFSALIFLIFSACKPDSKKQSDANAGQKNFDPDAFAEPAVPAESNRETALLTKDFWVFEYYVIPDNPEQSFKNRGLWYKFSMDGTYQYGHWEEYLGKGTWKLTYYENKPILTVDSETNNKDDMIWELNFGDYQGYEASFVASRYSQQPGVMCKMLNLMTRPTKKQFGYE